MNDSGALCAPADGLDRIAKRARCEVEVAFRQRSWTGMEPFTFRLTSLLTLPTH